MAEKNPFRVLGIDPEALVGLPNDTIQVLVEQMHRLRARWYHPDSGILPNTNAFQTLSTAFEELDQRSSPISYREWKERAVLTRKDPVADLAEQVLAVQRKVRQRTDALVDLWHVKLLWRKVHNAPNLALRPKRKNGKGRNAIGVERLRPCRILLHDPGPSLQRARVARMPINFFNTPVRAFEELDWDGERLIRYPVREIRFHAKHETPPSDVPSEFVHIKEGSHAIRSAYYIRKGPGKELPPDSRLLGSFVLREHRYPRQEIEALSENLLGGVRDHYKRHLLRGFSLLEVAPLLPALLPVLRLQSVLVSVYPTCENSDGCLISILGTLLALAPR